MSWFESNPKKATALIIVAGIVLVVLLLEGVLRVTVQYNPSYYTGFDEDGGMNKVLRYPYGEIKINNYGFPDDDFSNLKDKPRIGYFGDSVCYGVGAGYGFRITEHLETLIPEYEHMNFALVGSGIQDESIAKILNLTEYFGLDQLVYLMNLNDILPDEGMVVGSDISGTVGFLKRNLDFLRGKSYLYTTVRLAVKNFLVRRGYEAHGQTAFELYPTKYAEVVSATVDRINRLGNALGETEFVVLVLPYEMQVSAEAAEVYTNYGIAWEAGFLDGSTQKSVVAQLEYDYLDLYYAFDDSELGEYFVYNKGDKLDWNHPNRKGHQKIAAYVYEKGIITAG